MKATERRLNGEKNEGDFFASYGLNKMALKKETTYDDYFNNYDLSPEQQESFKSALELEGKVGDNGRKVSNSEGLEQRKQMEDDGTWESYYRWIMETGHDYKADGFTKTVVGYDQEEFQKAYEKVFGK